MQSWTVYVYVFLGAGIGGALRHGVNVATARAGGAFPAGTMIINVVGSLLIGVLAGRYVMNGRTPDATWFFAATGVLGGFTTFSAFSLDAATLWQRGEMAAASLYVGASVLISLTAVAVGLKLGRA